MSPSPASPPVLPPWPGRLVALEGSELHVRWAEPRLSGLPPAVYVHGLGGSARNWTDLMAELRDLVDGTAVDLPGFGYSPPPPDRDYSISAHAAALHRLLEYRIGRGGQPVHLLANSLGGAVATRAAALRPELLRTLTLISPAMPHLRPRRTSAPVALYGVPGLSYLMGRMISARTPEQRVAAQVALIYGDPGRVPADRMREAAAEFLRLDGLAHTQEAVLSSLRGLLRGYLERGPEALWRQAARVPVPTLLVYGQRDKLVDPRTARRAVRTFPDARLVVLPGSGHVAMMEYPRLVAQAFRDFVREVERGR